MINHQLQKYTQILFMLVRVVERGKTPIEQTIEMIVHHLPDMVNDFFQAHPSFLPFFHLCMCLSTF